MTEKIKILFYWSFTITYKKKKIALLYYLTFAKYSYQEYYNYPTVFCSLIIAYCNWKKWVSMNINVVNNNIQNLSSYQKLLHWLGIYEQWKMTEVPWWWIDLTQSHMDRYQGQRLEWRVGEGSIPHVRNCGKKTYKPWMQWFLGS